MKRIKLFVSAVVLSTMMMGSVSAQDYFLKKQSPFNATIPSPEAFLGYPIGAQHTRHDQIVSYLYKLAELSDRATIQVYGKTHEQLK